MLITSLDCIAEILNLVLEPAISKLYRIPDLLDFVSHTSVHSVA